LGKRTDQSGRTVITADPTLKMDELGVPYEMAQILTIPVYARDEGSPSYTSMSIEIPSSVLIISVFVN
jgi:DNA-directed RNA polymerase beta' subunit